MPFEELDHIGESAFRVSAGTLEELFQQAANAMYFTMQVKVFGSAKHQNLSLRGQDSESLLVMFLNELLILAESETLRHMLRPFVSMIIGFKQILLFLPSPIKWKISKR